jgi:hypothetical protein
MKKYISISILAIILLTFNGCKKSEDETATPASTNGTLAFHLHTMVDTAEVTHYDSVCVTSTGRKIKVHFAQLYLSNIQLIKLDGSTVDVPGAIVLQKQQIESYTLGSVPSGNYKSVRFNVGLTPAVNASTPAIADSTLNTPPMWFGNTAQPSGYVFINFQGEIDTTTAGNGTLAQMQPFSIKIGTNAHLINTQLPDNNFTVLPNQTRTVHIMVDYNMLFMIVNLNNSSNLTMNTVAANGTPLGAQLANNISMMFMY